MSLNTLPLQLFFLFLRKATVGLSLGVCLWSELALEREAGGTELDFYF